MFKFPPHFTVEELTRSQTATRNGINNTPDDLSDLMRIAWFLESLRTKIRLEYRNAVIIVSSGYRSPELNLIIGGSKTSAHMKGLAADISCPDLTPLELAQFIADTMADEGFDQVIHEFSRWVHVGLSKGLPRYELLTAVKENGKTVYKLGLI